MTRKRFADVIGDDHPDQPRFDGGVLVVALVVGLLWTIGGVILWCIT
jgi:hypothetical protein